MRGFTVKAFAALMLTAACGQAVEPGLIVRQEVPVTSPTSAPVAPQATVTTEHRPTTTTAPSPAAQPPQRPVVSTVAVTTTTPCFADGCGTTNDDAQGWRTGDGSCVVTDRFVAERYGLTRDDACDPGR